MSVANEAPPLMSCANEAAVWTKPDRHAPYLMTKDGRPRLAKWSFVPKGSTIMTDPADYFAFALREVWTDKTSRKSEWCDPILKSGDGTAFGAILKRKQIRHIVSSTFMLQFFHQFDRRIAELYRDEIERIGLPK